MPTVALIGPDGAGKTTISRMLERAEAVPCKYLYMGIDIPASNIALPTARWIERLKLRSRPGHRPAGPAPRQPRRTLRGWAWAYARLVHRLADEWFRQAVSWIYQARGFVVLYDRHFAFDFAQEIAGADEPLDRRLHRWCLQYLYPHPDLVLFLDAPGAVLFARKGESDVAELERRRQGFLALGRHTSGFVRVDATRPTQEVYHDVVSHIARLRASGPGVPQPGGPR
jgi:thymidylate kinase